MLGACGIGYIKIVFIILMKVIAFYIKTTIVEVGVPGLKNLFLEYKICFAIFLIFNKQF